MPCIPNSCKIVLVDSFVFHFGLIEDAAADSIFDIACSCIEIVNPK